MIDEYLETKIDEKVKQRVGEIFSTFPVVMTTPEVARFLGVSEQSIPRLINKGLPSLFELENARFVRAYVAKWKSKNLELLQPKPAKIHKPSAGFLYLFKCQNRYKIGKSKQPNVRMKALNTAAFPINFICSIPCADMNKAESVMHRKFADKRIHGEWFELSEKDVEYIKGIKEL
jgi:predicted DNA-binding transcriptional regulator AlpA